MEWRIWNRLLLPLLFGLMTVCLVVGCGQQKPPSATLGAPTTAAPTVAPVATQAAAPTAQFQPYTLLPQLAPKPAVVSHRHQALHLVVQSGRPCLVDVDRHAYQVGRDSRGRLCPIYRDPATHTVYPLYYDSQRDRYYRVGRVTNGRYYRNYIGDPDNRYYAGDNDESDYEYSDTDRPVIDDPYAAQEAIYLRHHHPGEDGGYPADEESAPSGGHHNNLNWLWAIPVVVGAYLLLQPHHHSSSPAHSGPQHNRSVPGIVRSINSKGVYNSRVVNTTVYRNTTNNVINSGNHVAVIGSPRPNAQPRPGTPPIISAAPGHGRPAAHLGAPVAAVTVAAIAARRVAAHSHSQARPMPAAKRVVQAPPRRATVPTPRTAPRPAPRKLSAPAQHPPVRRIITARPVPVHGATPRPRFLPVPLAAHRPNVTRHSAPAAKPRPAGHPRPRFVPRPQPRVIAQPRQQPKAVIRRQPSIQRPQPAPRRASAPPRRPSPSKPPQFRPRIGPPSARPRQVARPTPRFIPRPQPQRRVVTGPRPEPQRSIVQRGPAPRNSPTQARPREASRPAPRFIPRPQPAPRRPQAPPKGPQPAPHPEPQDIKK